MRYLKLYKEGFSTEDYYQEIGISQYYDEIYHRVGVSTLPRPEFCLFDELEKRKISNLLGYNIKVNDNKNSAGIVLDLSKIGLKWIKNYEEGDDILIQVIISKKVDEWYYVKIVKGDRFYNIFGCYRCDQWEGLEECV